MHSIFDFAVVLFPLKRVTTKFQEVSILLITISTAFCIDNSSAGIAVAAEE